MIILIAFILFLIFIFYLLYKLHKEELNKDNNVSSVIYEEKLISKSNEDDKYQSISKKVFSDERQKELLRYEKELEQNTPKFEEDSNEVRCIFKGKTFLFDKEGFKFFEDIFSNYGQLTIINNYLGIDEESNEWIIFFHRKFMQNEIEDFCIKNNCEGKDVEVHHIDLSTTNNKKENLRVMFKHEHKTLHIRLRFNDSNEEFEKGYKKV